MQERFTNINGRLVAVADARVPADDRSFRYGYGLFETMLALDGVVRYEDRHWDRLARGLQTLQFQLPVRFLETLQQETSRTIARHRTPGAMRIRLQVTAGSGGYFDAGDWKPFFVIECWPLPDFSPALNENGLVLGIAASRKEPGLYSALKSTNALCYAMAAREAKRAGWNDALLLNSAGHIVESCISNVFVLLEGRILTPPLTDGCVAGVMRQVVIERLQAAGRVVAEESISRNLLPHVDGIVLTNAIRGIRWAQSIEAASFNPDFGRMIHAMTM